jgi:hypothetical protein
MAAERTMIREDDLPATSTAADTWLVDRLKHRRAPGDPDYDAFYDATDDQLARLLAAIDSPAGRHPVADAARRTMIRQNEPGVTSGTNEARKAARGRTCNAERPIGSQCRPDCKRPTEAQAHCSVCHQRMGSVSGFDKHRDDGYCLSPADLGMVQRDGVWRTPMSDEARAAFDAKREANHG